MDTLFSEIENSKRSAHAPLAVRMRPQVLDDLIGQEDAVGEGTWLRSAILNDTLSSVILYGPAGTGKTSLAHVIAESTHAHFVEVSAIGGTVSDLRREINEADKRLINLGIRTILFVDEIHRFNRAQQDALLHAVEDGVVVLVGATTENPFFEVNSALISRSRIVELHRLTDDALSRIVDHALMSERGLNGEFSLEDKARKSLLLLAGGDARNALNTLSLSADLAKAHKNQDMHYDVISAFIKSMRGSDPDAALYWLARMIDGGEDPKFIARRIFIFAAEDIGNADPQAVLIGEAAFRSAEVIGYLRQRSIWHWLQNPMLPIWDLQKQWRKLKKDHFVQSLLICGIDTVLALRNMGIIFIRMILLLDMFSNNICQMGSNVEYFLQLGSEVGSVIA